MKRTMILMILAVLIALYLGGGALAPRAGLAFNSPVSPPDYVEPTATVEVEPTEPAWIQTQWGCPPVNPDPVYGRIPWCPPYGHPSDYWTPTPAPTPPVSNEPAPAPTATPIAFVPISPIFHSPLAAPVSLMCVMVAQASGHVLCYEVR